MNEKKDIKEIKDIAVFFLTDEWKTVGSWHIYTITTSKEHLYFSLYNLIDNGTITYREIKDDNEKACNAFIHDWQEFDTSSVREICYWVNDYIDNALVQVWQDSEVQE